MVEAVEEVGQALGGDACAAVFDFEQQVLVFAAGAELDGARVGVAQRVVDQVGEDLHEAVVIGADCRGAERDAAAQAESLLFCAGGEQLLDVAEQFGRRDIAQFEPLLA